MSTPLEQLAEEQVSVWLDDLSRDTDDTDDTVAMAARLAEQAQNMCP